MNLIFKTSLLTNCIIYFNVVQFIKSRDKMAGDPLVGRDP